MESPATGEPRLDDRQQLKTTTAPMIRSASVPYQALIVLSLLIITVVAYWPSSTGLWAFWLQDGVGGNEDGRLVALISVWLLFRSRDALATATVKPVPWTLPVLLVCSAGSMLFWRAGIETFQLALLPALMLLAILGALGTRIARIVAFPLGFLYFAVPGWGEFWPFLQFLTIRAVSVIALLVGLPVHIAGDVVTLPRIGAFEIGTACSGVSFFVVGLAVAALIGELEHALLKRRACLMVLMGAIAIVSNWTRVFLIIAIGYATNMHNPLATSSHLLFGWIVFAAALLLFLWLAPRSAPPAHRDTRSVSAGKPMRAPAAVAKYFAVVVTLIAVPVSVYAMGLARGSDAPGREIPFPQGRMPWSGPLVTADTLWSPQFVGPHSQQRFTYKDLAARSVEVVAIGYSRQEQGRELVNEDNSLVGKHGLTAIAYGQAMAGKGERFRELVAEDEAGHYSVIWWVYEIGGRRFATPIYSEIWYGLHALAEPPYSVLYAFRSACEPSCEAARTTLKSFIESNGRSLFRVARELRSNPVRSHA